MKPPTALATATSQFNLTTLRPELQAELAANLKASRASRTIEGYKSDWRQWEAWCASEDLPPIPSTAVVVAAYISAMAHNGRKVATIERHLAAITWGHGIANQMNPTQSSEVQLALAGIKRRRGTKQRQVEPLLRADLTKIMSTMPQTLHGLRDAAMLLVGFAGAFRESALVAIEAEHLQPIVGKGILVYVPRGKTDQEGKGTTKPLGELKDPLLCPVRSLRAWLTASKITTGRIFRRIDRNSRVIGNGLSGQVVNDVVKTHVARIGLDPTQFGGHSLRAGYVSQGYLDGVPEAQLIAMTDHSSVNMLWRYRRLDPFLKAHSKMGEGKAPSDLTDK